jgi:UDP-glucose 4-epimerase
MTTRVLVTGGAGYIGSIVTEQLLARSRQVVVLDDLSTGHREAIPEGVQFVRGGIGDHAALNEIFAGSAIEAIVHLAAFALVEESVANPDKYRANNVAAARVLLDAAVAMGVRRFVFSSSCTVYGVPKTVPIPEDAPMAPMSPYGETKLEFERVLGDYAARHKLSSVSLRYFNAAGASAQRGEDHDPESHLIPNVLAVALGKRAAVDIFGIDYPTPDGTAVRDYIHVDDLADAHVRALDIPPNGAIALNLGTGQGSSVRQVVETARRVTGHPIPSTDRPRRAGDPPALVAAPQRAAAVLGWHPRRSSLDEILTSAWRWHQAHPRGYRT